LAGWGEKIAQVAAPQRIQEVYADEVAFDTTPNGLISLAKGGVSKSVIAHMQKRVAKK